GAGLARGYHARPALTAERFVADPQRSGTRMYRTGDLARWRNDGTLEFLGRADQQVKIRGFRIEPSEIEAALLSQSAVAQAVVTVHGNQLVAYVVAARDATIDRAALRRALAARLPEHMVPHAFVILPRMPLTAAGKVDRRHLPAPERELETYRAPRTDEEEILCACVAEVLKLDRVGISDNFFALGGDSILSIQLVTSARRAGLELTPRDVFERMTVEALAVVCRRTVATEQRRWDAGDAIGDVIPTPIMRALLERGGPYERFHQWMLLPVPESATDADVAAAVQSLIDAHDALRMKVVGSGLRIDTRGTASEMLEFAFLPETHQLRLAIHHLAVDGVSWRILAADLETAWTALRNGVRPSISPAATPFRIWAKLLSEQDVAAELPVWEEILGGAKPWIEGLTPSLEDTFATARLLRVELPVATTTALLTSVPAAFHARINDVLLGALAWAIGGDVLVDLEGHGREPMDESIDLSRTVGWFTSLFPVRLTADSDLVRTVKRVKETLRAIPGKGLGYGLLAAQLAHHAERQIGFNYLGRFAAGETLGLDVDPNMPVFHLLDINAQTEDGPEGPRLSATWTWAGERIDETIVRELAERWTRALESLTEQAGEWHTPSDFPLVRLSQFDVDRLEAAYPGLEDVLPLSPLQQGLVFHTRYDEQAPDLYTVQLALALEGELDAARMRAAARAVLQRHANLRAAIVDDVQVIARDVELPWREVESRDVDAILAADRAERFELSRAPLIRFTLIGHAADRHVLAITNHHVLMDGWSTPLFINELLALYGNSALPRVRPYADYLQWLARQDRDRALASWREYLAGLDGPVHLAASSTAAPGLPRRWTRELPEELTERLQQVARDRAVTMNTIVQSVWGVLLSRLTGRDDVVFGATVSERPAELAGVEQMIGLLINTVPVRVRPRPGQTFAELLAQTQREQSRMLTSTHVGLTDIQRAAGLGDLFDTLIVFENYPAMRWPESGGLRLTGVEGHDASNYPLTLVVIPGDKFTIRLEHQPSRIDDAFADAIGARLLRLLEAAASEQDARLYLLDRTPLYIDAEREAAPAQTIVDLFEAQVARDPDALALVFGDEELTYGELNDRANRLAHQLISRGIGPESFVGISLERSIEMIVAVLAVMKAGGAYLPLDPHYPAARIAQLIEEAKPALVIGNDPSSALRAPSPLTRGEGFPTDQPSPLRRGEKVPKADEGSPRTTLHPQHPAYVIFTSGSTGTPKGVVVPHAGIAALAAAQIERLRITSSSRVLQFASLNFDASLAEIAMTLTCGAALVLLREDERSGEALRDVMIRQRVTHATLPPVVLATLDARDFDALEGLIVAGESCRGELVARWSSGRRMINGYGPTETTVCATMSEPLCGSEVPPIGKPIPHTRVYVLDRALEPAPAGVPGELYIAGLGLARGYHERPALTAERFVADPHALEPGARMYRSGDLARWRPDGTLEFLGRVDQQVKLRGFRIEPGEIEAALVAHAGVDGAAVIARDDGPGGRQLVAYLVARDVDIAALRDELSRRLPDYMVPSAFVVLDGLPLTPNGKLDRAALPAPAWQGASYRAPRTPREEILCALFAEVLSLPRVGIDDHFFHHGGDSLLASRLVTRIRAALSVELAIRTLFEAPTVAKLAERLQSDEAVRPPLTRAPRPERVPLSYAQQRLWFLDQLEAGSTEYNMPEALRLRGALDVDALRSAIQTIVARHESLRTHFEQIDGVAFQVIEPEREIPLRIEGLTPIAEAMQSERDTPFELGRGPLLRVRLLKVAENEHVLLVTFHHIVSDGWSMDVFHRELAALYEGRALEALAVQYADFALWQRELLDDQRLSRGLEYWMTQLAGIPERLELPADRPRPATKTYRGATCNVTLDASDLAALTSLSRANGSTLYMTLLAAFAVLLERYSGQSDLVIGSPIANRQERQLEQLIGIFVNSLAMRVRVPLAATFSELLADVRRTTLDAYLHQDIPFERIVEQVATERTTSHAPIFQVLFALQNTPNRALRLSGLEVEPLIDDELPVRLDLEVHATERDGMLDVAWGYNRDLFDRWRMEQMAADFIALLQSIAASPAKPLHALGRRVTPASLNAREVLPLTLPELFEAQVARTPHATALVFGEEQLTYEQLNAHANELAQDLIARGIGPEDRVGVCLERSIEMIVAILGIAKAGAAYLPLDPKNPEARLAQLIEEAKPAALISRNSITNTTTPKRPTPNAQRHPTQPAYVIFTSGSTGTPKGVVVTHAGIASLAGAQIERLGITLQSRVLQFASLNFDASLSEIVMALTSGAALVLMREEERAGAPLRDLLIAQKITHATLPPVVLATLDARDFPLLEGLIVAGESCPGELVARWSPGRRMINAYGPTETTVCATMSEPLSGNATPPIGTAIWNARVYVLDARLEPVPAGANGELYIAGIGLARGYLDRAALTAERFVADPHGQPGSRMYRTGDLARVRRDGTLEFLGRVDQQVKLRGFRIELGEIEAALLAQPSVTQAAATIAGKQLVAYVVPRSLHVTALRDALAERLPDYMVPSAFVTLDALPLTVSGKVDRAALPAPRESREGYRAPRTRAETILCELIAELLALDRVGIADNYFTLGGDSIVSIQLVSRARKAGLTFTPRDVFRHQTVEALAAVAKVSVAQTSWDADAAIGEVVPTPVMRWFLERCGDRGDQFHQSMLVPVPADVTEERLTAALQALIDTHDVLRLERRAAARDAAASAGEDAGVPLNIVAHRAVSLTRGDARAAVSRLNPREGRVFEAVWFAERARLLLVIHHLAVDAVSWRILIDDLNAALRGEALEPVPTPFRVWAQQAPQRTIAQPAALDPQRDTFATAGHLTIELPATLTNALLTSVPAAFHARIDDVLLTALGIAAESPIVIDVEGHGRDSALDLSRTVGWFTSIETVRIDAAGRSGAAALKRVKEQLRIRHEGGASIGFNYLGRTSRLDEEPLTDGAPPEMPLFHLLDVNAETVDGRLTATWTWAKSQLTEDDVQALAEGWREALETLAGEVEAGANGHTPSDFALVDVTQDEIERLETKYGPLETILPLSPLQEGLLFHTLFDRAAQDAYAVQFALELEGPLDAGRLRAAAQALLERHPNLRAAIHHDRPGKAVQVIPRHVELWNAGVPPAEQAPSRRLIRERRRDAASSAGEDAGAPLFDLTRPPLLRLSLEKRSGNRHVLKFVNHHILMDGWSLPLFFDELFALYRGADLPRARPYADYLTWLREQDADAALATWRDYLSGLEEPTRVAPAGERQLWQTELSAELSAALQTFARERGVTLNTIVQALWAIVIARLTGREEVLFGATVSGRPAELSGVEKMIGLFINTVPVRVHLRPAMTLAQLLDELQESQSKLIDVQHTGLADIQRVAGLGDLFETLVVFENYPLDEGGLTQPDDSLRVVSTTGRDATHYPLTLMVEPGARMIVRLDGNGAEEIATRFVQLLETAIANADTRLYRLGTSAWDLSFRSTDLPNVTVLDLLHAQAARTPDRIALLFDNETLTYAELDARANRLAHHLIRGGVGPETIVGVALERSSDLVIALVAIVKAGGAYLPLDPDYPDARLEQMLDDGAPLFVLSTRAIRERLPDAIDVITLDSPEIRAIIDRAPSYAPTPALLPLHPAYVIYTSGSTGRPKGVPNTHEGLVNRLLWMQDAYNLGSTDRVLQKTPYSFDVSVWEFFWPLIAGATLVVAPPGAHRDPSVLAGIIESLRITTIHFVPSMLRAFLGHPAVVRCAGVRRVICSGEALPGDLQAQFFAQLPSTELHNLYGPTEAAIDVTAWACDASDGDLAPPIGTPIWNTRAYVLDSGLEPVPIGVAGELYLSGIGLARGYHQRPALTAERFVADPHAVTPGARMYRTGDRALWRSDGALEFLGRADQQVKIRGFRIEPGEIESVLMSMPGITQAAVVLAGKQLVAYVVGAQPDIDALRRQLPEYMVPSAFVMLDALPLTQSGKLDRRALPAPQRETKSHRAPRTEIEASLCKLFAEVLSIDTAGIDDNFFTHGGDSILSIQLVSAARRAGIELTPRDVFEHPTIESLATVAKAATRVTAFDADAEIGKVPLTPIMRWYLRRCGAPAGRRRSTFYQAMTVDVSPVLREEQLIAALQTLLDHHAMLRLRLLDDHLEIAPRGAVSAADCLTRVDDADEWLDPRAGRVLRAVWNEDAHRLLLVIHHLAVDGVSWQILLPDFFAALNGTALEPVPVPFRIWAEHLVALVPAARAELPRWQAMLARGGELVRGARLDPANDTFATAGHLRCELPVAVTRALLTSVPAAFHGGINDVLLAALAVAIGKPVLVDVEGHGRESERFDLSRTVGWFTSLYPVALVAADLDIAGAVKQVKEQLRAVPGTGLGYGLLRYLDAQAFGDIEAQVGFNYLGRQRGVADDSSPAASDVPLAHLLEINAATHESADGPRLSATWTWARAHLREADVQKLAGAWQQALETLVRHVEHHGAGGHTPSDFPLVALTQAEVARFEQLVPSLETILPLAPLQQGLLFHSLYEREGRETYAVQVCLELEGPLDARRLRNAAQALLERHPNLRAAIHDELQVIAR
ncbi:MAG: amino acid adenylation domain-containing protein, partial [Thermoanaerobaculia bacterium]